MEQSPSQTDGRQGAGDSAPRLLYIHSMLGELRVMAEAERCDMLAYLIEMATLEAADIVRGQRPVRPGRGLGVKRKKGE